MSQPFAFGRAVAIMVAGSLSIWIAVGVTLDLTAPLQATALVRTWWPLGVRGKVVEGAKLTADAGSATIDRVRETVRQAAVREPVNTDAVSTLAALNAFEGHKAEASKLFSISETLSRRNSVTEYWLIENAVSHGDVAGAVLHYDRAMRVSNDARIALLPVLVDAASGDAVLHALLPLLSSRPKWWKDYVAALLRGNDPRVIGISLLALHPDLNDPDERLMARQCIDRMLALGADREAIVTVNRLDGHGDRTRGLLDGGFDAGVPRRIGGTLPFAWELHDDEGVRAYRAPVPTGGTGLRVVTTEESSGSAAQQLVGLPPGRHVIQGTAGGVPADAASRPSIQISCRNDRPVSQTVLPSASDRGSRFSAAFDVPADCPTQWIRIVTAPATDADFWIDSLAITS